MPKRRGGNKKHKEIAPANTNSKSNKTTKAKESFIICPVTQEKVWISNATLADMNRTKRGIGCKPNKKKVLHRIPSTAERQLRYREAASALEQKEEKSLPEFGGRPWNVTVTIQDSLANARKSGKKLKSPLFRWFRGNLELACLPHLLEKIPDPPKSRGKTMLEQDQVDEYNTASSTELQERVVSTLSTVAWNDRDSHAIPALSTRWLSPNHAPFYSRKAAWEHSENLTKQQVLLDKVLRGYGARGQKLKPFKPTKAQSLQVGRQRFLRDGLWVVGQEEAWQENRRAEMDVELACVLKEERECDIALGQIRSSCINAGKIVHVNKCSDSSRLMPNLLSVNDNQQKNARQKMSPLQYYMRCNREEFRKKKVDQLRKKEMATMTKSKKNSTKVAVLLQSSNLQVMPVSASVRTTSLESCSTDYPPKPKTGAGLKSSPTDDLSKIEMIATATTICSDLPSNDTYNAATVACLPPASNDPSKEEKSLELSSVGTKNITVAPTSAKVVETQRPRKPVSRPMVSPTSHVLEVLEQSQIIKAVSNSSSVCGVIPHHLQLQVPHSRVHSHPAAVLPATASLYHQAAALRENVLMRQQYQYVQMMSAKEPKVAFAEAPQFLPVSLAEHRPPAVCPTGCRMASQRPVLQAALQGLPCTEQSNVVSTVGTVVVANQEILSYDASKSTEVYSQCAIAPRAQVPCTKVENDDPLAAITASVQSRLDHVKKVSGTPLLHLLQTKSDTVFTSLATMPNAPSIAKDSTPSAIPTAISTGIVAQSKGNAAVISEMINNSKNYLLRDADKDLRLVWKDFSVGERKVWAERARRYEEKLEKEGSCVDSDQSNLKPKKSRRRSVLDFFIYCRRGEYRTKKFDELKKQSNSKSASVQSPIRFTLHDADRELRELWKAFNTEERKKWKERCDREQPKDNDAESLVVESVKGISKANTGKITPEVTESIHQLADQVLSQAERDQINTGTTSDAKEAPPHGSPPSKPPVVTSSIDAFAKKENGMHLTFARSEDEVKRVSPSPSTAEEERRQTAKDYEKVKAQPELSLIVSEKTKVEPEKALVLTDITSSVGPCKRQRSSMMCPPRRITPSCHWRLKPKLIDLCYEAAMEHYHKVMHTVKARGLFPELADGFDVLRERGRGRFDMELPAFDTPLFDFLTDARKTSWIPVVKEILGEDATLIHKGVFISMPGADAQVYHQDGPHLTTKYQKPCHAVNVFIPLVDLHNRNGPTEFCLGTHILGHENHIKDRIFTPTVPAGTPIIFDYRLGHRGLGNSSSSCRPIVYCTYAASTNGKEFRDSVNFSKKRYHKIGDLVELPLSREERAKKRHRPENNGAITL